MKHTLLLTLFLAISTFSAENLFPNPGFKMNSQYGMPNGWQRKGKLTKTELGEPIDDGKTAVLKIIGKDKECNHLVYLKEMKPEVTYLLTLKVKAEKGGKYNVFVQVAKPKFQTVSNGTTTGTGEWQDIALLVRMGKFESTPYFAITTKGDVTLQVAAPSFTEYTQKPVPGNLIKNAQFIKRSSAGQPLGFDAATKGLKWKCVITSEESYLKIDGNENDTKPRVLGVYTPVKPGVKYTFSAEFKAEEGDFFRIGYQENVKWKSFESKKMEGNDQWQKASVTFTFPEIKKASYGMMTFYGTGDIKVRNIVLIEEK